MVNAGDLSHVGVVTPDLAATMEELSRVAGYDFLVHVDGTLLRYRMPDGDTFEVAHRAAYSLQGPVRVELIEAREGTLWAPRGAEAYVHHWGYVVTDLVGDSQRLEAAGTPLEVTNAGDAMPSVFAYHRSPHGLRIELLDADRQKAIEAMLLRHARRSG